MSLSRPKRELIKRAVVDVGTRIEADRRHRASWRSLREEELWRELVTCILGSRVPFRVACASAQRLSDAGLLGLDPPRWADSGFERKVQAALRTGPHGHPFASQRAGYIQSSAISLYGQKDTLRRTLTRSRCPTAARRALVEVALGVGPKQASLFLNSIGYSDELAVFDTHSLTYMCWTGMLNQERQSVGGLHQYEELERVFVAHARELGFAPSVLDLAVWVVVRVAKELQAV